MQRLFQFFRLLDTFHLPHLGDVPWLRHWQQPESDLEVEPHLVSLLAPQTFEAEQYWSLSHMLEQLHHDVGLSVIAVSSPTPGDGKTTVSINIASTLSQAANARILIVETDLRRPRLSQLFDLEPRAGLGDIVKNARLSLDDVIHHCPPLPYPVLPAGQMVRVSANALNSPRVGALFQEARQRFDYIIVDTPPLLPFPDCRVIKKWVDGFMLLVTAHKTPRKLVEESLSVIGPKKLVGLVFNNDDRPLFGYSSYYHYRHDQSQPSWQDRLQAGIKNRGSKRQPRSAKQEARGNSSPFRPQHAA